MSELTNELAYIPPEWSGEIEIGVGVDWFT